VNVGALQAIVAVKGVKSATTLVGTIA
jgi:hypothetical protein